MCWAVEVQHDWLVVGAGFAASLPAGRPAAGQGERVLVMDHRPHVASNAFDCLDVAGLPVHHYGPQVFHTNSRGVFDYLSDFTDWRLHQHRMLGHVSDFLLPTPTNLNTALATLRWIEDALPQDGSVLAGEA